MSPSRRSNLKKDKGAIHHWRLDPNTGKSVVRVELGDPEEFKLLARAFQGIEKIRLNDGEDETPSVVHGLPAPNVHGN